MHSPFRIGKAILAACLIAVAGVAHAIDLRPLRAANVDALFHHYRGQPLVVELWSLDCSYCHENTERIAQWRRAHPRVRMLMVAMDPIDDADDLQRALATMNIAGIAQYANDEAIPEKLRGALDPGWRGEMPRTLFIDAQGQRRGVSGLLSGKDFPNWH